MHFLLKKYCAENGIYSSECSKKQTSKKQVKISSFLNICFYLLLICVHLILTFSLIPNTTYLLLFLISVQICQIFDRCHIKTIGRPVGFLKNNHAFFE